MKKLLASFFLSLFLIATSSLKAHSQELNEVAVSPASFIGISTGLDYNGIIALACDFKLGERVSLAPSAGLGSWGFKLGADMRVYRSYPYKLYYVVGFSRATGIPEPIEMDIETNNNGSRSVKIKYDPVNLLNLGFGYSVKVGSQARFMIELGYSAKMSSSDGYSVIYGSPLSSEEQLLFNFMRPGGLRLGFGFNFGF